MSIRWDNMPLVLRSDQVCELLSCSRNTLYELCRRGEIPSKKAGAHWLFSRQAVRLWLEGGES